MEKVKAIILNTFEYSENQRIINTFSKEKGYISFITPAMLLKRKNNAVNIMQAVEIEYYDSPQRNLHRLKNISPYINTTSIYFDIYKMNIAILWGEVLNLLLKKEPQNEGIYKYIVKAIEYLNESQEDTANFNLFFLYRFVFLLGFKINTETYQEGYVFNINEGIFIPSDDETIAYISGPNAAKTIYQLCTCKVEDLKNIKLNRDSRRILLDVILLFYSIHIHTDFNIKSIKVIREIFE